jgi:hypothetical protein
VTTPREPIPPALADVLPDAGLVALARGLRVLPEDTALLLVLAAVRQTTGRTRLRAEAVGWYLLHSEWLDDDLA